MADVTGSIGSEHVELNNAATEATLKLLLHSNLAANKQSIENIKNLAQKSGLNPEAILATEEAFAATTKQTDIFKASIYEAGRVVGALSPALKKITEGTGQASDLLQGLANASSGLPIVGGVISAVVSGFATLAKVQESYLLSFESISKTGASFNGSLSEMRISASQAYLTLDQFSKVVKTNQDVFSSLGGDVQKGVDTFVRIQNTLLAPGSAVSKNLGYLGVSAEEAADLTASYIRSQGTLNKTNLQDATKVSAAVGQYAQELTVLSELTGKSREELRNKLEEENAEAQWQNFLAQMDEKKADKFRQGMEMQMAEGGKPAMEAYKSLAMGFPPLTKAAQLYAGTQQAGMESIQKMVQNANNAGLSLDQSSKMNRAALAHAIAAGSQEMDRMRTALQASGLAGTELANTLSDAQKIQNKYTKEGKMMSEAAIAADLERIATDKTREDGNAEAAQQTQRRMQELGQKILTGLMPTFEYFQNMLNENIGSITYFIQYRAVPALISLAQGTVKVVEYIKQNAEKLKFWGEVLGSITLGMIGFKAVVSTMAGIQRTGAALGIPGLGGLGASIKRPMYVYVTNIGALAGAEAAAGAESAAGKGGGACSVTTDMNKAALSLGPSSARSLVSRPRPPQSAGPGRTAPPGGERRRDEAQIRGGHLGGPRRLARRRRPAFRRLHQLGARHVAQHPDRNPGAGLPRPPGRGRRHPEPNTAGRDEPQSGNRAAAVQAGAPGL
jgi:hypothetical protein